MKKSSQDDLFDLVRSLDSTERGYFSKFAQRHVLGDGNNYEFLFQMLLQMPAYDGEALETALLANGIHTPLAAAKSHLKTIIFRAMREYNSQRSAYKSLHDGLANLSFLYDKKLYALLRKELKRLKKIALLYQEHNVLFKIGDFERRLHKETIRKGFIEGMEDILLEMKGYAADFQNQLEFTHLMDRAFVIANKAGADRDHDLEELLANPILRDASRTTTLFGKIYRHQVFAIAAVIRQDFQASLQEYDQMVTLWESAPHWIKEYPSNYRRVLGNFMGILGNLRDFSRFDALIADVRSSPSTQPADKVEIFTISYSAELLWRMGVHDWDRVAAIVPAIEKGLLEFEEVLSPATVLTFRHNCAIYFLVKEDHRNCAKWLRAITEAPPTEQRMDIQRMARLLSLLLIWKKRDISLLEYELRSLKRSLESASLSKVEACLLELSTAILHAHSSKQCDLALQKFVDQLSDPSLKEKFGVLALRAWATAQSSGEPATTVLEGLG